MVADETFPTQTHRRVGVSDDLTGPQTRPRLAIVGTSVIDIVQSVGGLTVDYATSGWQVDAYTPMDENLRPLRILGARSIPYTDLIDAPVRPDDLTAMAVSVGICQQYPVFCQRLSQWFAGDLAELIVWGDPLPLSMGEYLHGVDRPISNAAVAFKKYALHASGVVSPVAPTESFCWGSQRWGRIRRLQAGLG